MFDRVTAPLKFTDTATNQTAEEGNDFVLQCEVTGGTVSWAVEGGDIIERKYETGFTYKISLTRYYLQSECT